MRAIVQTDVIMDAYLFASLNDKRLAIRLWQSKKIFEGDAIEYEYGRLTAATQASWVHISAVLGWIEMFVLRYYLCSTYIWLVSYTKKLNCSIFLFLSDALIIIVAKIGIMSWIGFEGNHWIISIHQKLDKNQFIWIGQNRYSYITY